jgi:hypothetical protein
MANIGQQLLDVPIGDMVRSLGLAIAEAQFELDRVSLRMAQMMSGTEYQVEEDDPERPGRKRLVTREGVRVQFGGESLSMLELGFTPSFYQFVDTVIEVKISISIGSESRAETSTFSGSVSSFFVGFGMGASATSVSASYAQKYSYSAEGSSLIRTKLAPVPPPAVLEQRIKQLVAARTTP